MFGIGHWEIMIIILFLLAIIGVIAIVLFIIKTQRKRNDPHTEYSKESSSMEDISEELSKLAKLKEKGILTEEEFTKAKNDLLSTIKTDILDQNGQSSPTTKSSMGSKIVLAVGILMIGVSIACFVGSSDIQGRISDPAGIASTLFNRNAAYQLQQLRSQAQILQYGGIVTIVVGGVLMGIGLIRIIRK